jgi:hypothetical protein
MKLLMYVMDPEPISTAYFINLSHQSVCLYVQLVVARQRLGKYIPTATNTRNSRRIISSIWCLSMSGSLFSVSLMPLVKIVESCSLQISVVAGRDEGNVNESRVQESGYGPNR